MAEKFKINGPETLSDAQIAALASWLLSIEADEPSQVDQESEEMSVSACSHT